MSQVEYDVDEENNEEDDEIEYIAVEDEEEDVDGNVDDGEDEDEEDDESLDARVSGNRDDDDDDDTKKTRRDENRTRRQRQREARDRNQRELNFLRSRNEQLERRFSEFEQEVDTRVTGSELASVEGQINKAKSDLQLANQVIAQAAEANNGQDLAEALNHRDNIRDSLRDLEQAKEYLGEERKRPAPAQELDPRHVAHAQAFMRDNDWWDPRGGDPESQVVLAIDRSLVQEGYNPVSKEYWDELRTRTQKEIPDRFPQEDDLDDDPDDPPKQKRKGKRRVRDLSSEPMGVNVR